MGSVAAAGVLAAASAFGAGALAARWLAASHSPARAKAAFAAEGVRPGALAAWLRNGAAPAKGAARLALRSRCVAALARDGAALLTERGLQATPEGLASVAIAALAALALAAGLVSGSAVAAAAVPACAAASCVAALRGVREARREAVRESVPELLRSIEACLQAGYTLVQTFRQVAKEAPGPLREAFSRAALMLEAGRPASEALEALKEGANLPELSFVAVALEVQHEAGGSMRQVLAAARDTVEGEMELKRSLRVHTAQAKLSARIVSVMPLALVALFSLVSEGFLEPFFASPVGWALLALAVGMQVTGIFLVRRMLSVEIAL
ncbi:MAG TPA: type II secretion system F family protein [Candidatus Aphodovivens avistercoris]|nr:type II secretion system F family protein [Candidatus Aphodovivens avistercoris]